MQNELFISYAHLDDQPLTTGQQGWVSRFHATLEALVNSRIGRKSKIWRDESLQGNNVFSDEIVAQLEQTAVFVPIVTSRYLASEWCTREVKEFCGRAQRSGGLVVDNKSRVFKVIKTPLDTQESLPQVLKDVLGYEFFIVEEGAPLELDPAYGDEYGKLFTRKVAILAFEVSKMLKALGTKGGTSDGDGHEDPTGQTPSGKPTIYLAECSYDRKPARELVEGELKRLGYLVLPDQRLPSDEADYVAAVERLLARSALSIHLVGDHYGAVPDGTNLKSVGVLQNELAVARCKLGGLTRLIWLPAGTQSEQAPQRAFIDSLMAQAGTAWRMAQFRPGGDPIGAMARALAQDGVLFPGQTPGGLSLTEIVEASLRMSKLGLIDIVEQANLADGVNLLLVVDQFEELFRYRQLNVARRETAHGISEDATAFVNLLLEVKELASLPIFIVLTMRSDFLSDCTQFPGLTEAINAGQYLVPRMTRDERRAAIVGPVGVGGAEISPVLVTRLVNDVGDNPDQLSILQHALNRTWARWRGNGDGTGPLDLAHYEAIGTMAHALDQHAERAYAELATPRQQQICEKLFKATTVRLNEPWQAGEQAFARVCGRFHLVPI